MKIYTFLACIFLMSTSAFATNPTSIAILDYVQTHNKTAIKEMKRSGIPASILLGQAIMASEQGEGNLVEDNNNHFAVKCGLGWKGEVFFEKQETTVTEECFRAYPNSASSFADYTSLIMEDMECRNLFQFSYYDYKSWANGLQTCLHAADENYAAKLIKLIKKYDLAKYDSPEIFSPVVQKPIIGYEFEIN